MLIINKYNNLLFSSGTIFSNQISQGNVWLEVQALSFHKTGSGPYMPVKEEAATQSTVQQVKFIHGAQNMALNNNVVYTPYNIKILWSGFVNCDIDYLAIDNDNANNLYNNDYDAMMTDFVNNYKNYSAMRYYKVWDEPYEENYYPVRRMSNYITQRLSTLYPTQSAFTYQFFYNGNSSSDLPKRYLYETQMNKTIPDVYPIDVNTPVPGTGNYLTSIQGKFSNGLIPYLASTIQEVNQKQFPFYFCVQAHKWLPQLVTPLREPSAYEIKSMVNLAVCYGAKGIKYYIYTNNSDPNTDNRIGLLDSNENQTTPPSPRYTDAYGYSKWNTLKQLNQKLASIGNELISLTWQNGYSINLTQGYPGYISNIRSYTTGGSQDSYPSSTYVELGTFKRTDENNDNLEYFYVVNRRTAPTEQRYIRVYLNKSSIFSNWKITEVGTPNSYIISKTGNFITTYQPGEGKLFKMEPVMIAGGTLSAANENIPAGTSINVKGTVTVPSGKTLTIGAGCNLTFDNDVSLIADGLLNAQGTSSQRITFTFQPGSQSYSMVILKWKTRVLLIQF